MISTEPATNIQLPAVGTAHDDLEKRVLDRTAQLEKEIAERRKTEFELRGKTAFFHAMVDSSLDGIFVIDNNGRKLLQNRQAVEMWKIPEKIAAGNDGDALIRHIGSMIKDSGQFRREIIHLYSHPDETSRAEVELKDGTVLDRFTSPVRDKDGIDYGRIWAFRDIT